MAAENDNGASGNSTDGRWRFSILDLMLLSAVVALVLLGYQRIVESNLTTRPSPWAWRIGWYTLMTIQAAVPIFLFLLWLKHSVRKRRLILHPGHILLIAFATYHVSLIVFGFLISWPSQQMEAMTEQVPVALIERMERLMLFRSIAVFLSSFLVLAVGCFYDRWWWRVFLLLLVISDLFSADGLLGVFFHVGNRSLLGISIFDLLKWSGTVTLVGFGVGLVMLFVSLHRDRKSGEIQRDWLHHAGWVYWLFSTPANFVFWWAAARFLTVAEMTGQ